MVLDVCFGIVQKVKYMMLQMCCYTMSLEEPDRSWLACNLFDAMQ